MSASLEFREVMSEEQANVLVDLTRLDLVKNKHVCRFSQEWKPESLSNA